MTPAQIDALAGVDVRFHGGKDEKGRGSGRQSGTAADLLTLASLRPA